MEGKNPLIHHTGCPFCLFLREHASVRPFVYTAITRQCVPVIMAQAIILCQQTWISWLSRVLSCLCCVLLLPSHYFNVIPPQDAVPCINSSISAVFDSGSANKHPRCPFSHLTKGFEQLRGGTEKLDPVCIPLLLFFNFFLKDMSRKI